MTAVQHDQISVDTQHGQGVEVVIAPFSGFGRLAHLRRALLAIPGVRGARIASYDHSEARFVVDLDDGTSPSRLQLPGTRITHLSTSAIALAVVVPQTA